MKILDRAILLKNIEAAAQYDLERNNLFGCSYFVYQNGETILKKHFGTDGKGAPLKDDTMFRIASMTKPITAVAMSVLTDQGFVKLSDPVSKFLPEFKNISIIPEHGAQPITSETEVTVMHLLTHTSGFGSTKPVVGMTQSDKADIASTVRFYIHAGLDFEPFTKAAYSAYAAFDVLAAIAEKVTGTDYAEFLRNQIFTPCDMNNTTFVPSPEQWMRFSQMHGKENGNSVVGKTFHDCVFEDFPCKHKLAGAGLASTLEDYANFAVMLLRKGKFSENRVISEQAVKQLSSPFVPERVWPGNESWGLGVRVITSDAYENLPVGSYGWSGAFGSHFWVDPQNDVCAVFMKNSRFDGGSGNQSARRFESAVHNAFI